MSIGQNDFNVRNLSESNIKRIKNNAAYLNNLEIDNVFTNYLNLYQNIFEWTGFPEEYPINVLEEILFWDGKAGVADDPTYGLIALNCSYYKGENIFGEPTGLTLTGIGYSEHYDISECVLVRENQCMYPPARVIKAEARRISDAMRTIDVYAKTMKKPWLVTGQFDKKYTYESIVTGVDNNELCIITDKDMATELPRAYPNTQDANGLMALWRHKHELEDNILTRMGINNANTDKRERLITDEAQSNNILLMLNIDLALDWRKKACEEIKTKLGYDVSVDIKHDYVKEVFNTDGKLGEQDSDSSGSAPS